MSLIDSTYFQKGLMAIPNLRDENLSQLKNIFRRTKMCI